MLARVRTVIERILQIAQSLGDGVVIVEITGEVSSIVYFFQQFALKRVWMSVTMSVSSRVIFVSHRSCFWCCLRNDTPQRVIFFASALRTSSGGHRCASRCRGVCVGCGHAERRAGSLVARG